MKWEERIAESVQHVKSRMLSLQNENQELLAEVARLKNNWDGLRGDLALARNEADGWKKQQADALRIGAEWEEKYQAERKLVNKMKAERYATSKPKLLSMLEEHPGKIIYSPSRNTAFRISHLNGHITQVNQLTGELTDGSPQIELKYFATTDWLIAQPIYKPRAVTREQALKEIKPGQIVRRKTWTPDTGITACAGQLEIVGFADGPRILDELLLGGGDENWEVQRVDTVGKMLFAVNWEKGHPNGEK